MSSYEPRIIAIVPAGGVGERAGTSIPKQYQLLLGEPMLRWAVKALLADARIEQVRVAIAADDAHAAQALRGLPRTVCRPCGGPTRAATVLGALRDSAVAAQDWVLVHDAARPGLPANVLTRLIDTCVAEGEGGLLAEPVADTVKRAAEGGHPAQTLRVACSVSREGLWMAQTPQMFPAGVLRMALEAAEAVGAADASSAMPITDEASAMELAGHRPLLIRGSVRNLKVTWPEDFELMERLMDPNPSGALR